MFHAHGHQVRVLAPRNPHHFIAAIQVLGTPASSVFFRSFHNDAIGGDSDDVGPAPMPGDNSTARSPVRLVKRLIINVV